MSAKDEAGAPKVDDEKDKKPPAPAPPPPPPPRDARKPVSVYEKRTTRLFGELELRLDDADEKLAQGDELEDPELRRIINQIRKTRNELAASLEQIASDDPLLTSAFKLEQRATKTLVRLEALDRARTAHVQTAGSRATGSKEAILAQARAKAPVGYCDGPASADAEHCELTKDERGSLRSRVSEVVLLSASAWTAAINAKRVDELLRTNKISFEQKLGDLLLGLLFTGFGAAAKHGIKAGAKKVTKALSKEDPDLGWYGLEEEPDQTVVSASKTVAEKGASKGLEAVKESGKGHKTPLEVDRDARVEAPSDRNAFLQVMKSAPTTWAQSILRNLNQLYDEDLAAILVALPTEFTQADFEAKIDGLLKRFDEQVMAVNRANRPITIMGPRGQVLRALVTPDMRADSTLHGDARYSRVPTGKTRFVRWIDADMIDMATSRHRAEHRWALPETRRFDDVDFWDADSLSRLEGLDGGTPESIRWLGIGKGAGL